LDVGGSQFFTLRFFCKKIPKKFGDIKEIAYLCTVKTFKGHEAAAPKKAAYFMHGLRNMLLRHRVGYRTTTPKVHPLNDLDSA
jgi:hypothetical protein